MEVRRTCLRTSHHLLFPLFCLYSCLLIHYEPQPVEFLVSIVTTALNTAPALCDPPQKNEYLGCKLSLVSSSAAFGSSRMMWSSRPGHCKHFQRPGRRCCRTLTVLLSRRWPSGLALNFLCLSGTMFARSSAHSQSQSFPNCELGFGVCLEVYFRLLTTMSGGFFERTKLEETKLELSILSTAVSPFQRKHQVTVPLPLCIFHLFFAVYNDVRFYFTHLVLAFQCAQVFWN